MDVDVPLPDVVAAYWRHHELCSRDRRQRLAAEELFWAWEAVEEAVERDPDVLAVLDALLAAPGADACYVGAGPVEQLLLLDGPRWDAAVAERCRRSSAWREAVASVWLEASERRGLVQLRPFLPPD